MSIEGGSQSPPLPTAGGDGTQAEEVEHTNIVVMARCRPFNSKEIAASAPEFPRSVIIMEGNTVRVLDPERNYVEKEAFQFDHALWSIPESQNQYSTNTFISQLDVFELTGKPAVANALQGYHNTIFAYGQTGSGKTHSMLGHNSDEGIAPQLVRYLFHRIEELKQKFPEERMIYTIELSFLEIYNEKVKDLLSIADRGQGKSNQSNTEYAECKVRFHPEKGTFVEGLQRCLIETEAQCLQAIKGGMEHRAVTATLMNDTSSRSHAIFQVSLTQKSPLKGTTRMSNINLVDLAGSERIKMSGAKGQALQEAKSINLSLSTLRRVIDVLIDNSRLKKGQRPSVPPYRESTLTWILSDSLGGNSKTMMIVAVSPYAGNVEDSLGTLRYGLKAKAIVCNARVNEEKTAAVVNALRNEMDELRRQLEAREHADQAEQERLETELAVREQEFSKMQEESNRLDNLKEQYEFELKSKAEELTRAQEQMDALQHVEEEKTLKQVELEKARLLQIETEQKLREQEEERRKKDAELEAVILRRNSLKKHHDRAAEEEARAKLAAEQARLRQFVSAFQNAFLLGKQRSGLEDLKEEHAFLGDRVAKLQADLTNRETQLQDMITDKVVLQRKVTLLEKRCENMQTDLEEVLLSKSKRLEELNAVKVQVEAEHAAVLEKVERQRSELAALKQDMDSDQDVTNTRLTQLEDKLKTVTAETADKRRQLEELRAVTSKAKLRVDALDKTAADKEATLLQIRSDNAKKEQELLALQQRKAVLVVQREQSQLLLEERQKDLSATQAKLDAISVEADKLREHHAELRQFVSNKFFPVGGYGRSGSPQQRGPRGPSPTLNAQRRSTSPAGRSTTPKHRGSSTGASDSAKGPAGAASAGRPMAGKAAASKAASPGSARVVIGSRR